jgi:hypothetical protein
VPWTRRWIPSISVNPIPCTNCTTGLNTMRRTAVLIW